MITGNRIHQPMFRIFDKFMIIIGVLYGEIVESDETVKQLVLHSIYKQVMTGLHNGVGHQGEDRTVSLLKETFHWLGNTTEITD